MAVVSLNLTKAAMRAYEDIPKGSRSRILSSMIAQRDFKQRVGGPIISPGGILEGLDVHTAGEAIIELKKITERQKRTIARLTNQEVIE